MADINPSSHAYHGVPHRRRSRLPFILVLLLIIGGGLWAYASVRDPEARRVKLALVTWNNDPFWDRVIQGAEAAAKEANVDLEVVRSGPTEEEQTGRVRELISKNVEGIAISPNNPTKQNDLLNEVAGKATLVTFDVDAPQSKRKVHVGADNYAAGYLAAQEVKEALPDGAKVIVSVGGLETPHSRDRRAGLIDCLLDRPFMRGRDFEAVDAKLEGPKHSVVATILDDGQVEKGKTMLTDALKAHPEANCIVGLYSYSAESGLGAISAAGRAGRVTLIAFDDNQATIDGIRNGGVHASVVQDQWRFGHDTVAVLAGLVRSGNDVEVNEYRSTVTVPISLVRKENLEDLLSSRSGTEPATRPAPDAQPAAATP